MKNLIKAVIKFLILIFISFTANAENVLGSSWLQPENSPNIAMSIYINDKGKMALVIEYSESLDYVEFRMFFYDVSDCRDYDPNKIETLNDNHIFNVEGQGIRMRIKCYSGSGVWEPVTKKGNDFIINKFKRLGHVKLDGAIWNAKGFTKEYNRVVRLSKAL